MLWVEEFKLFLLDDARTYKMPFSMGFIAFQHLLLIC